MTHGFERLELELGPEPQRRQITQEVTSLSDGPVNIALCRDELTIVDAERDLGESWSVDYLIIDPNNFGWDAQGGTGYKGLGDGETVVLGRHISNRGRFNFSDTVSRAHVQIKRFGDSVEITDLDSTNGTYMLEQPSDNRRSGGDTTTVQVTETVRHEAKHAGRLTMAGASVASELHPERNEDAYFVNEEALALGVFDGVGGAPGSEAASQVASSSVEDYLRGVPMQMSRPLAQLAIREALTKAHSDIIKASGGSGIATTATIAKIFTTESGSPYVVIGSVGDSRASLLRQGEISHITQDQAYMPSQDPDEARRLQETLAQATSLSRLSEAERVAFYNRNIITSYLGGEKPPVITLTDLEMHSGDRLLITSDGIHDNLTTSEIEKALSDYERSSDTKFAVEDLVKAAVERSRDPEHIRAKPDDMTAVMFSFA